MSNYDVAIIGSGAGGGALAYSLSRAGLNIIMIEKGNFISRNNFTKDELAYCRRDIITPSLKDEYHIIEEYIDNKWQLNSTKNLNSSFWNGNIVGGSSNFMSGMFHKLSPDDFRLKDKFKNIENANIENWAISSNDLEPYYQQVKELVGITTDTKESSFVRLLDKVAKDENINILKTPRAILSKSLDGRDGCYYSNFCGSYGCSSGAKGSSLEAFITPAIKNYGLKLIYNSHVKKLISSKTDVSSALIVDTKNNSEFQIKAKIFVVSAQAHESVRLLFNSANSFYPNGLANSSGELGKNLIFSAGGYGLVEFEKSKLDKEFLPKDNERGYFINRSIKEWIEIDNKKGAMVEFMFEHANPISKAIKSKYDENNNLLWGQKLVDNLKYKFNDIVTLRYEIFADWLPNDDCYISVDKNSLDKYGMPVGKLKIYSHPHNLKIAKIVDKKLNLLFKKMNASKIYSKVNNSAPQNLIAGGCRFGDNPKKSILNSYCQTHDIKNLFVVDASFMPTGGSVPYTWTIYANALRIADYIKKRL